MKIRQEAPTLAGIRDDCKARYRYAAAEARRRNLAWAFDVGCGVGYGSWILAEEAGLVVFAYDRDEPAIDYGEEHYRHMLVLRAPRELRAPAGESSGSISPPRRVRLSRWGRKLLRSSRTFSADILPRPPCLGTHPELETRLWDLRRRLAAEEERAPFSVFSNSTLAALAAVCPRDLGELAEISGFGEARIRKYGRAVLDVVRSEASVEDASVATASGEKSELQSSRVQQMQQRVTLHQSSTKRPHEEETGEKAAHVSRPADVGDPAAGVQSVAEDLDR